MWLRKEGCHSEKKEDGDFLGGDLGGWQEYDWSGGSLGDMFLGERAPNTGRTPSQVRLLTRVDCLY